MATTSPSTIVVKLTELHADETTKLSQDRVREVSSGALASRTHRMSPILGTRQVSRVDGSTYER